MTATTAEKTVEQRVDDLLVGAIDPHVHSGPSIAARSVDHLELAREASKAGMAAIVTKDHDYSGVMTAALISKHFPELTTRSIRASCSTTWSAGSIPMRSSIPPRWAARSSGCRRWRRPTICAGRRPPGWAHPASTQKIRPAIVIPVLDDNKKVRDDVKEILDVVAKNDMALASGHIHVSETWLVFEEAQRRGVKRLILTHPEDIVDAAQRRKGIAAMGAYVEHSLCMFLEGSSSRSADGGPENHIDAAGVDNTILCSDLGQVGKFDPIEGFRRGIRLCIDLGYRTRTSARWSRSTPRACSGSRRTFRRFLETHKPADRAASLRLPPIAEAARIGRRRKIFGARADRLRSSRADFVHRSDEGSGRRHARRGGAHRRGVGPLRERFNPVAGRHEFHLLVANPGPLSLPVRTGTRGKVWHLRRGYPGEQNAFAMPMRWCSSSRSGGRDPGDPQGLVSTARSPSFAYVLRSSRHRASSRAAALSSP